MAKYFTVSKQESNQKIFNYLQRKFLINSSDAHKWIRKGDVRINGKKCKAFDRIEENDEIRMPPFAQLKSDSSHNFAEDKSLGKFKFDIVFENDDLLVINKPSKIPVQEGSKQAFSITTELRKLYKDADFMPTPAHRLDKDTSGLLLIAKSYNCLNKLHRAFQDKEESNMQKFYLAYVTGEAEKFAETKNWDDWLSIKKIDGKEKTFVLKQNELAESVDKKQASSKIEITKKPKKIIEGHEVTLLQIQLITGRKHQIRAQCAHRNIPILGDVKYGGTKASRLYLHAYKFIFEDFEFTAEFDPEAIFLQSNQHHE